MSDSRIHRTWIKIQICYYIMTRGRYERIGQFLSNRMGTQIDLFRVTDKSLLNMIRMFDILRKGNL